MTAMLAIRDLWKRYDGRVVLERVNLSVDEGEFCTVVGASGCGKSTFLRMLLSQERPSGGEIVLDGSPLPDDPDSSRGVVFQRYSVYPHLTVLENVALPMELSKSRFLGRLFGRARRRVLGAAEGFVEAVGLTPARDAYPAALSGGMQQRLAIAQALAREPRLLLLDEPFGALDPGTRADMHALIRQLWQERRMTVFMVTHDIQEGFALGTRVLVFDKTRHDAGAPDAYGATVTYDIALDRNRAPAPPAHH